MSLPLNQHRWIETGFYVKYKGRPKNRKKIDASVLHTGRWNNERLIPDHLHQ